MPSSAEARECLAHLDGVRIEYDAPLNRYARFGVGGPADVLLDAASEEAFARALEAVRGLGVPWTVIGGGTNLIVADEGYRGAVLRY
ncbi:MAG: UDP-N-acetylenolpyruvoylglucosamine reductase, partial [Acidobacteria bacterium]|nr:UDP-N-acetylenolpyruvoylglucosamine reductase [Acidobacteriota bacterium]